MKLLHPRMCWEYSAASFAIIVLASHLATSSCSLLFSLNDALYSHAIALELSVSASIFSDFPFVNSVKWIVMAEATNSSKFIDSLPTISFGKQYRHANPLILYPPIPNSHASDTQVSVGSENVRWLMSTPFLATVSSSSIHHLMSSFVGSGVLCGPNFLHRASSCLILFKKNLP